MKNRKILNIMLMELIVKQRRVDGFYQDLSYFEKIMQKLKKLKVIKKQQMKL